MVEALGEGEREIGLRLAATMTEPTRSGDVTGGVTTGLTIGCGLAPIALFFVAVIANVWDSALSGFMGDPRTGLRGAVFWSGLLLLGSCLLALLGYWACKAALAITNAPRPDGRKAVAWLAGCFVIFWFLTRGPFLLYQEVDEPPLVTGWDAVLLSALFAGVAMAWRRRYPVKGGQQEGREH